ncbi:unnamed protein product, partial [Adineta steineri]
RLEYTMDAPVPDDKAHKAIIQDVLKERPVEENDIPCSLTNETKESGGALIKNICDRAYKFAEKESIQRQMPLRIYQKHFDEATAFFTNFKK